MSESPVPPQRAAAQLNERGNLCHFLSIEGMSRAQLERVLDTADSFMEVGSRAIRKVPLLRGKTVANLFFEASTRTRSTFELAAKRLSADVLNISIETSAATKGESLSDMLRNLEAMAIDMFVVRHAASGAPYFIARSVTPGVAVINAGDGRHEHPTQAMLDMLTIRQQKGSFSELTVTIVGDILHSRVARSEILALKCLGAKEIRVVAPDTLMPRGIEALGATRYPTIEEGLADSDVVVMLRLQRERMQNALLPSEQEFFRLYGLTEARLARAHPEAIVMHPGPMNRGVEIDSAVADGERSVILRQVTNGIAVRMAAMSIAMSGQVEARTIESEGEGRSSV